MLVVHRRATPRQKSGESQDEGAGIDSTKRRTFPRLLLEPVEEPPATIGFRRPARADDDVVVGPIRFLQRARACDL